MNHAMIARNAPDYPVCPKMSDLGILGLLGVLVGFSPVWGLIGRLSDIDQIACVCREMRRAVAFRR